MSIMSPRFIHLPDMISTWGSFALSYARMSSAQGQSPEPLETNWL